MLPRPQSTLLLALIAALAIILATMQILSDEQNPETLEKEVPTVQNTEGSLPSGRPPLPSVAETAPRKPSPDAPAPPTREGFVRGRIVTTHRRPVRDATVIALRGSLTDPVLLGFDDLVDLEVRAKSDESGHFRLNGIPYTSDLVLRIEGQDFATDHSGPFTVKAGSQTDLGDLVVNSGIRLEGLVVDDRGEPVHGAHIGIHHAMPFGTSPSVARPSRVVFSGENGRFVFEHLGRSGARLFIQSDSHANALLNVPPEENAPVVRLTAHLFDAVPLAGKVVAAEDNRGLANVRVTATPIGVADQSSAAETLTGPDGRFTLSQLVPNNYLIRAAGEGRIDGTTRSWVDDYTTPLTLTLKQQGSIEGQVLDGQGEPVPQFDLLVRRATTKTGFAVPEGTYQRVRDTEGLFQAENLNPGHYTFEIWAPGYALTASEPVKLKPSQRLGGLVVTLDRAASMVGRVVDDLGSPIPGAAISLHPNHEPEVEFLRGTVGSPAWLKETRTDLEGAFELNDLTAMSFQVQVDSPGHAVVRINDIMTAPGKQTDVGRIEVPRAASLQGVALDVAGNPVPDVIVHLGSFLTRTSRQGRSNSRGEFIFDRVMPGRYTLSSYGNNVEFTRMLELFVQEAEQHTPQTSNPADVFDVQSGEIMVRNVTVRQ
ncbi:MAG: carboxypeptidase-like regulatory domain-containing protein [Planctomycetota bacterium]|nr:carboxypeptidase-like regulatory domain-containing protein [Planctomycetota bacterium]